jgi:hypothetical protein
MAFSPLALGSVEQEATHGGVPMATEQKTTIFRDNPFSRTTDYWCRFFFDRLLVSVLFWPKKELTPIIPAQGLSN